MADPTDDDILETADRLAREHDLDEDVRNAITLAVQRLIWPPSPHYFLHLLPHAEIQIGKALNKGWYGELRCQSGCGRKWMVHRGPSEDAVYSALTAAHEEYRTGTVTAEPPVRNPGSLRSLRDTFEQAAYIEVHDERLTPEGRKA